MHTFKSRFQGMLGFSSTAQQKLSLIFFFFCIGHKLNALLFHPDPEKTHSLFLTAGCPRTVAPINEAPCSRPAEPSAADDGRA